MTYRGHCRNASDNIADRFLEDSNLVGKQCSAFALAKCAGLVTRAVLRGRARGLVGKVVHFDPRASAEWQEAFVTRCVARWAIRWYRAKETPELLRDVTRALLHRPLVDERQEFAELG